ncbi:ABC transporter permease [Segetibacter sp. 3557_3]|uniref:ABC transporter permease n=1 Tax=Segetibacter sp. 3557_3 TaxID=2547429 RepID=UPI0010588C69|nr:ABC transporter permease [Segetibacter sp. 3557_3]TDH25244.1 ABC transporter permease [Segetibacter sp. 3557_3]
MFRNYLLIATRLLIKQKMYSAIKIGGLALSIAACLLITLYIKNELSYDRHIEHGDRVFRLVGEIKRQGVANKGVSFQAPMSKVLLNDFSEVEEAGRIMPNTLFAGAGSNQLKKEGYNENTFEDGFCFADQSIIDILEIPIVRGDKSHALTEPNSMVVSKSVADKYYPNEEPVGKVVYLDNNMNTPIKISAVMGDFPEASHLQYRFFLSLAGVSFWEGEQDTWQASNYGVYVKLRPGVNVEQFERKLTATVLQNYIVPSMKQAGSTDIQTVLTSARLLLQPVTAIHLQSFDIRESFTKHGDMRFVWLFGSIACFILVIACINFVNLSTAKSANRAKEVGLRKVVGSVRSSLIHQFLTESFVFSLLSLASGIVLAWLLLPYFNELAAKSLTIPWDEWWFFPGMVAAAIAIGFIAGLYPSFYLSGFKPINVLKGQLSRGSKSSGLRNGLVVFQFTTSIILIIGTFVIYNQMQYILNKKLGFDKEQVLIVEGANSLGKNVQQFKSELQKLTQVKSVSISDYLPVEGSKRNGNGFWNDGKVTTESAVNGQFWIVDEDYFKTLGINLAAGKNFSPQIASDSQAVVINQTLANKLNLKQPVGNRITNGGNVFTIIGVVEDFHFQSMRNNIEALCMQLGSSSSVVSIKTNTGDMSSMLSAVSALWKKFVPGQPIRYTFLDDSFAAMYADVQRMGRIFTSFALLAIVIACLGLFALSAFMAEQRRKEISIHKILGASVGQVSTLLSKDFLKLVIIAFVIASPIAWWAMNKWLQDFVYRVNISWWIFLSAGVVAILIALLTVSFQAIKAALANPVKSLRTE